MGSPSISISITHDPEISAPISSPPTFSLVIQITKIIDPGEFGRVLSEVQGSLQRYIDALQL